MDEKPCIACVNINRDVALGTELEDGDKYGWGLCPDHKHLNIFVELSKLNTAPDGSN